MLSSKPKGPVINEGWCKGCGICAAFCPKDVLEMKQGKVKAVNRDACNNCGLCEMRCPDYAIYLEGGNSDE
jgi:2-oxoglutarate ferredoxin oxidoreductase subunit delta